ncbi:MAG: hypothetical protein CMJ81_10275 [Planctomycetaceae bacterium]|nr:hypothetical protein [Planctomycetaceae bacterium]MBP60988.1 hypothetical protein [Planctomycetaceae bacterium]
MLRWLKPWGKKRGARRSGSRLLGSLGEALFFAFLFLLGSLSLVVILTSVRLGNWPSRHYFPELFFIEATGKVVDHRQNVTDAPVGSPNFQPEILVKLKTHSEPVWVRIAGPPIEQEAALLELGKFEIGQDCTCWHSLGDLRQIQTTEPTRYRFTLVIVTLVSLVLIGAGGVGWTVVHEGTTPERRSSIAQRAADLDLAGDTNNTIIDYPSVPDDVEMTNSPGIHFAYRLPIAHSPVLRLLAAVVFSLVWTSIAAVFVQVVVRGFLEGKGEWMLGVVTVVFLALASWSVYDLFQQLAFLVGIGPTSVEISHYPLSPGTSCRLLLTQSSHMDLQHLNLLLACDEQATYRQGTDVRTEVRRVREDTILKLEQVRSKRDSAFEHECELHLPEKVMHSFRSPNNSIQWKLIVNGKVGNWPFERVFPIVVFPEDSIRKYD